MRCLIVADNALTAEAIRRELRYVSNCRVLGYLNCHRPNASAVAQARPNVVLIDDMGRLDVSLRCVAEIRAGAPDAKIVLLATSMDREWLTEAAGFGIDAAVAKTVSSASLGLLIREVVAGNIFHSFAPKAAPAQPAPGGVKLTLRELEILRQVAAGASNSRIAADLFVTEQTVKFHLSNVYRKLDVSNRTEASHYAHVHGLLEPGIAADRSLAFAA